MSAQFYTPRSPRTPRTAAHVSPRPASRGACLTAPRARRAAAAQPPPLPPRCSCPTAPRVPRRMSHRTPRTVRRGRSAPYPSAASLVFPAGAAGAGVVAADGLLGGDWCRPTSSTALLAAMARLEASDIGLLDRSESCEGPLLYRGTSATAASSAGAAIGCSPRAGTEPTPGHRPSSLWVWLGVWYATDAEVRRVARPTRDEAGCHRPGCRGWLDRDLSAEDE